jgi:hypothetical protein
MSSSTESQGMKAALAYAGISSAIAAAQYAPNDWHRPSYPHIHILAAVSLNVAGAVIVGLMVDQLKHLATTRLRSAAIGFTVGVPLMLLVYLTVYPKSFSVGQILAALLLGGAMGAAYGAVIWLQDDA